MENQKTHPQLLLVEDDRSLAGLVTEYLEKNGFAISVEDRGDRAVDRILGENPDLVILDVGLPGMDGFSVCKTIRPSFGGPILILTARGDEVDEVIGLEIGADDYLAKPVRPRVLLARLRSLLRRTNAAAVASQNGSKIELNSLVIDARSRTVHLDQDPLELTTGEFDLLWFLAQNAGEVLSRQAIYKNVRGISYDGLDRSIDLRISKLRKKLGDDPKHPERLKSVRGVGYLLVAES